VTKIGGGRMAMTAATNSFRYLNVAAGPLTLGSPGSVTTLSDGVQVGNAHTTGGGSATLDIVDGDLTTAWIQLGNTPGTAITATVNQSGGSVRTTSDPAESAGVRLGHYPAATTFYNLSNGSLLVDNGRYLTCAVDGTGTFYQTGGEATAERVVVNARGGGGGNGTFELAGGQFNLGSGGVVNDGTGPATVRLGGLGGTLRATADWNSSLPMTLSGTGANAIHFDTNGKNVGLSGQLGGGGGLVKEGDGTLTLSNQNPYTGGTTVDQGVLNLTYASSGNAAIRGTVTVNSGAELRVSGGDGTGFGYASSAGGQKVDTLNIVGGLVNSTVGNHLYYATVNMTGGEMTIGGGNSYQFGNVAVNTLASADTATISGGITIRGDSWNSLTPELPFNVADGPAATDLLVSAVISENFGTGRITKTGAGVLTLTGDNTYTGPTTISEGTLTFSTPSFNTYRGGTITIEGPATMNVVTTGGFNRYDFQHKTIEWDSTGGGTLSLGAGINFVLDTAGSGTTTFRTNDGAQNSIVGPGGVNMGSPGHTVEFDIAPGAGASGLLVSAGMGNQSNLRKSGDGVLTLAGSNGYSGTTTVADGTLLVNGTHAGGGMYSVQSDATLGGSGTIGTANADVTVQTGGGLAPGGSIGTLTFDLGAGTLDLSQIGLGALEFELGAVDDSDMVVLTSGTLDIDTLNFDEFSFLPQAGFGLGIYTPFDADSPIDGYINEANGRIGGIPASIWIDTAGHDVLLGVVPEPSTLALAALGLFGLAFYGRRRKRRE
jgi:autotransporter-associated beta strand protein